MSNENTTISDLPADMPMEGRPITQSTPSRSAAAEAPSALPADELARLTDEIIAALKTVYDPESFRYLRTRADLQGRYHRRPQGYRRYDAHYPKLSVSAGTAAHGRSGGQQRRRRSRGGGKNRLAAAVGTEPHVRRGTRCP